MSPFVDYFSDVEWIVRMAVALLCGGLVGFEREVQGKTAGLRTNMLVAMGACVYTMSTMHLTGVEPAGDWVRIDPARIIEGVAGGIGFLGAGAIIQARGDVRGLTTAAAIWVSGAVGLASGLGLYGYAFTIAVGTVCVLWLVGRLEHVAKQHATESDDDLFGGDDKE